MPLPTDHAGLEVLPFDSCLSLLAAVSNSPGPVSAAAIAPLGAMIERLGELFALAAETVGEPAGDDGALVALIEEAAVGLRGVRADFQPSEIKPAGLAVKRLIEAVGDHEIDGLSVTPGKPDIYRFKAHKGRARVEIVWTPDAPTSVSAAGAKATDLVTGQSRAVSNGKVPVNSTPVLLSWTT